MLLEEFDAEKYERTIRKEGIEIGLREGRLEGRLEGRQEGHLEGRLEGQQQGMERANKLTAILLSQKRIGIPGDAVPGVWLVKNLSGMGIKTILQEQPVPRL